MIAGLPKARRALLLPLMVVALSLLIPFSALAEEVQTPSSTIPQTIELIAANPALSEEQKAALSLLFEDAAAGEYITDAQGVALLGASGLSMLAEGDDPAPALDALALVLGAITTGAIDPDGAIATLGVWLANGGDLAVLAGLLEEQASPPGILNAIGNALSGGGYVQTDSSIVAIQVELLIQAGAPPGIAVRVVKQTIAEMGTADMALLLSQLQLLGELLAAGESPGHAANAVTGHGQLRNRHQEEELEQNENETRGVPPGQEKEKENNGNANGKKKP